MAKRELILLALDDPAVLQLMQSALRSSNYEPAVVQDTTGLEKVLGESSPSLLLIGELFNGKDGLKLAEKMLERFPTLPVLLYAEKDQDGLAKRALEAGISNYFVPPLGTKDIINAVQTSTARALRLGDWLRR